MLRGKSYGYKRRRFFVTHLSQHGGARDRRRRERHRTTTDTGRLGNPRGGLGGR